MWSQQKIPSWAVWCKTGLLDKLTLGLKKLTYLSFCEKGHTFKIIKGYFKNNALDEYTTVDNFNVLIDRVNLDHLTKCFDPANSSYLLLLNPS